MRDVWILSKVLLKNTYRPLKKKKKSKAFWNIILYILLGFCMVPLMSIMFLLYRQIMDTGMSGLALQTGFLVNTMMVLMTALFTFPTMFYFSEDTMVLLPLPIKPKVIVSARLVVIYISCLTSMALFGLPLLAAWLVSTMNVFSLLWLLFQLLLTSLSCMLVLGILTLIVMRFLPFFANKDRFNLIIGILAIVFSLSISLGFQSFGQQSASGDDMQAVMALIESLQKGGIMPMAMSFFFWLQPAIESVIKLDIVQTLLSLLIPVVFGLLFFWLADRLYLPAVTSAMASTASKTRKKLSYKSNSFTRTALVSELQILCRTPAYMTNCVLSSMMMPVVMGAILLINPELTALGPLNTGPMSAELLGSGAVVCGIVITLFCGSLNPIASTAISRMGISGANWMKTIPVPFGTQLQVKVYSGMIFTVIADLFFLIVFHRFLAYDAWADVVYILACTLCAYLVNWEGLFCDGVHPKLIWENETAAVKNNYNMVFSMLFSWGMLAVLIVPGVMLFLNTGPEFSLEQAMLSYAAVLIVLVSLLSALLTWKGPQIIYRQLQKK